MIAMKENTTSSQTGAKMRHQGTLGSARAQSRTRYFFLRGRDSHRSCIVHVCIWECAVVSSVVFTHAVRSWHLFLFFFGLLHLTRVLGI